MLLLRNHHAVLLEVLLVPPPTAHLAATLLCRQTAAPQSVDVRRGRLVALVESFVQMLGSSIENLLNKVRRPPACPAFGLLVAAFLCVAWLGMEVHHTG